MKSKVVAQLMADLGVTKTHSRHHVSSDNPYSESQFKTLKACPAFPDRFGSIQDSRSFCQDFFTWYNKEHRSTVLRAAFERKPQRFSFKGKMPEPPELSEAVWIHRPSRHNIGV